MQSETNKAGTTLPANDIGSSQGDPDRCVREADAATDRAEKQLFDAVIAHPLHQLNNHWWGRDLTSDLEEYERFLKSRAHEIRRVIKATRSLFTVV